MIRVTLLSDDSPTAREMGRVEFQKIPVASDADYICIPKGVLTFEDAQRIARDLGIQKDMGYTNQHYWKR
jgi:hypothetical protein